jgi:hypothetical protein
MWWQGYAFPNSVDVDSEYLKVETSFETETEFDVCTALSLTHAVIK